MKIGSKCRASPKAWCLQDWLMVKRFALVEVVSFALLVVCTAACQNRLRPLPDAPSVQSSSQTQDLNVFFDLWRSPLISRGMPDYEAVESQRDFGTGYEALSHQKQSRTIFDKYLLPSSHKQQMHDYSLINRSLMGRATHAATRIIITRDETGRARLNATYLLRAATSVAADTASTPYWKRSVGEPFSDFGSTVGGDAGMNVWHEVGPGLQHLMKSHAPKFVSRIEEHIVRR
ncbi:MAG: hypothetical protein WAM78_13980 [Candidatus Sulfotelmatobacter sp.]